MLCSGRNGRDVSARRRRTKSTGRAPRTRVRAAAGEVARSQACATTAIALSSPGSARRVRVVSTVLVGGAGELRRRVHYNETFGSMCSVHSARASDICRAPAVTHVDSAKTSPSRPSGTLRTYPSETGIRMTTPPHPRTRERQCVSPRPRSRTQILTRVYTQSLDVSGNDPGKSDLFSIPNAITKSSP